MNVTHYRIYRAGTSTPRGWLEFGLALRSDGIAFAWGHGQDGQLGNGSTADSPVPVKVAGLTQVTGISAGWFASVATRIDGISAVTLVWTGATTASGNSATAPGPAGRSPYE